MPTTTCPKCEFQQKQNDECLRCGIIFARFHPANDPILSITQNGSQSISAPPKRGLLRSAYRVFRWVSLASLILVLILILRPSTPPRIASAPDARKRVDTKIKEFQQSVQQGRAEILEMDEAELNGWLGENLPLKRSTSDADTSPIKTADSAISLAKKASATEASASTTAEQVQSSVRDVKIELRDNSLRAYVAFELYGKNLSLELEGQLTVREGCLRLLPAAGKLGSLPLLAGTLNSTANRLFDSPQNREKFRLPPQIQDIHIERGQLVILSR